MLQREPASVTFWGWGKPGTKVHFLKLAAAVSAEGEWKIQIDPQPAGAAFGTGKLSFVGGDGDTLELTDVSFGEVWMCTGQSNMGVALSQVCTGANGECPPEHPVVNWAGDISDGRA